MNDSRVSETKVIRRTVLEKLAGVMPARVIALLTPPLIRSLEKKGEKASTAPPTMGAAVDRIRIEIAGKRLTVNAPAFFAGIRGVSATRSGRIARLARAAILSSRKAGIEAFLEMTDGSEIGTVTVDTGGLTVQVGNVEQASKILADLVIASGK